MIGLNRRRMMGGKKLPYDAKIEYLESLDTQWVDTGIVPNFSTTVKIKGILYRRLGYYIAGARTGSTNDNQYVPLMARDKNYCKLIMGSVNWLQNGVYDNAHEILFNEYHTHNIYIDGVNKTAATYGNIVDAQTTLALFATNGYGSNHYTGKIRIYYCKILINGALVRDFIPVRVSQVGYMYDKVSGQLFGNSGTGEFILGPDVTSDNS